MKSSNINKVAVALLSLGLASCGDSYLDTSSKTALNSNTFYQTELQANYAVVGCYDGYQRTVSNGSWPTLFLASEFGGDDALGGGGPDDRGCRVMDRMDMSYNASDVSFMSGLWSDYYKAINRCNQLLQQIDDVDFSTEDAKNAAKGEALALRGLEYFDLVKLFENVPLLTTPTSDIVPQATPDSVYAQVVSDLKWAADHIPASYYTDKSSSLGRITRYAAGAMLARVYLFYDGVYNNNKRGTMPGGLTAAQALAYCESAINSGQYKLETNFKDLWPAASTTPTAKADGWKTTYKEASDEIVWVVKFNNDQDWNNSNINGNKFIVDLGVRNIADGSCAPFGNGWGQAPITRKAYQLFQSGDTRREASIVDLTSVGVFAKQITTDAMDATGYINEKYCPLIYTDGSSIPVEAAISETSGANFQTSQDQDWILMRYSDVLLMAAELGSTKAMTYFNMVRERAFGDTSHDLTAAPTIQQIWDERRLEFMGEGLRYWDLRRQGLDAFVSAQLAQGQTVYNNTVSEDISSTFVDANFRTKRGFWQIPNDQITLSGGVYKQNAGW
jgi:hypothetical protein